MVGEKRCGSSASQDKKESAVCKLIKAKLQFSFTFQFHMCHVGLLQLPVSAKLTFYGAAVGNRRATTTFFIRKITLKQEITLSSQSQQLYTGDIQKIKIDGVF